LRFAYDADKPTYTAFRPHIKELLATFDTIFIMAYDNGNYVSKAPAVGPNSPLTGGQIIGDWQGNIEFTVNDSLQLGVPARQLTIGIPVYGRQYPTFGMTDSPLDRQLRLSGTDTGNAGVNGSHPDVSQRTIGYPLSLSEFEEQASHLCGAEKDVFFGPFYAQNRIFTKTGSGQTKHRENSKKDVPQALHRLTSSTSRALPGAWNGTRHHRRHGLQTVFPRTFYSKNAIILPRQARDKHKKNLKTDAVPAGLHFVTRLV
jgi:GH18 family chitinase